MKASSPSRILYVEDEADIGTVVTVALETTRGYHVEVCASAEEALAKAPAIQPDLILLDLMLPGVDGTELFGQLRELPSLHDVPVIFVTAAACDPRHFERLGALGVVTKPFDPIALGDAIEMLWSRA